MATQAYKNTGGVYANMDFPPYQYREYPKHVATGPHGQFAVVNTLEEELKLKGTLNQEQTAAQLEAPYDAEKEALIEKAKFLGAPINRLWSKAKISSVIAEAEAAIDNLPPEAEFGVAEVETSPEELDDLHSLVEQAKELGVKNARASWGVDRLKANIAKASE